MGPKGMTGQEVPGLAIGNPAAHWGDRINECRAFDSILFRVGVRINKGHINCDQGPQAVLQELQSLFPLAEDEVPIICDLLTEFIKTHPITWVEARMAFVAELACRLSRLRGIREEQGGFCGAQE